ncbi:MAG TPA: OmpH family outer membrane protein [Candidatus Mcinerneyibacterium sp.]|nr:OmpH family outer membrane protein [Candidatus Mcinerneyibacterium sp.]
MKKIISLFLIVFLIGTAVVAQNIAVVDVAKVYDASNDARKAQSIFQKEAEGMQKQMKSKYDELLQLQKEFKEKAQFLSEKEVEKKKQELMKKQQEFNQLRNKLAQQSESRRQELMKPILEKIKAIVANIAKEKNYDAVINKEAFIYSKDNMDITSMVIERLNKK